MLCSRLSRLALSPPVPPARPRLRSTTTLLLQPRSNLAQPRPFTNPPKPDVVRILREIARAETLRTKGNAQISEAASARAFAGLFLKDVNKRYLRDREWRSFYIEAQQSMKKLYQMLKTDARRAIPTWTVEEREILRRFLERHSLILTWGAFAAELTTYTTLAYVAYKIC